MQKNGAGGRECREGKKSGVPNRERDENTTIEKKDGVLNSFMERKGGEKKTAF